MRASVGRFTALSGVSAVVLYVLTNLPIADLPDLDAPGDAVVAYAAGHAGALFVFTYLWGLLAAATLAFLTGLWGLLRAAGRDDLDRVLALLGAGAGYVTFALGLAGLAPVPLLAYRAATLDPAQARLLLDLALLAIPLSSLPTVACVGPFAALILRTGALPRWVAWAALLAGAAHLVAGAAFARSGPLSPAVVPVFVAPLLFYVWVLATGVAAWRAGRRPLSAAVPA